MSHTESAHTTSAGDTLADAQEAGEVKPSSGPGARLLAARESRNMSVAHIASLLRLDTRVIRAIEADDAAQLPSATFVKGYLRSYAPLVDLDGTALVAEYDQLLGPEAAGIKVHSIAAEGQPKAGRWIVGLVVLIVVMTLAWYSSNPSDQPISTDTLQSSDALPELSQTAESAVEERAVSDLADKNSEATDEVVDELLVELQHEQRSGSHVSNAHTLEPAAGEGGDVGQAGSVEVGETGQIESKAVELPRIDTETVRPEWVNLRLVGRKTSWVSVRDAREERIFRDNLKAGATRDIAGLPPIIVNLGNASGVDLYVDGQRYDHQSWHKANGTARFVLNLDR